MSARFVVADVFDGIASLDDKSVNSAIYSPPYWRKRAYMPGDPRELGQESSPGEFLANALRVTDALWRVVRDDGTIWVNLGDSASASGGAGGDYNGGGLREGQHKFKGTPRRMGIDQPLQKSVCWVPELFGASLAYGRNLLTGEPCRQWITRPPVTWCKPSVTPGEIFDKFKEATELIVWASKQAHYHFDLDAVRNENGAPPFNWWVVNTSGYSGAHFATFPPELIVRPIIASCPPGGTILDPFAGSGTTLQVAEGHGRNSIGIDFDPANADLARDRCGLFLTVENLEMERGPLVVPVSPERL